MPALSSVSLVSSNGFFRRFEDGIKPTQHAHRQNDIGILAAFEQIPQNVVGDSPDKRDNLFVSVAWSIFGICTLSKRRVRERESVIPRRRTATCNHNLSTKPIAFDRSLVTKFDEGNPCIHLTNT